MSLNVWSLQFSKQVPNGTFGPIWKMIPLLGYLEKVFHPWLILWKKWQFFFFSIEKQGRRRDLETNPKKSSCVSYQQWQTSLVTKVHWTLFFYHTKITSEARSSMMANLEMAIKIQMQIWKKFMSVSVCHISSDRIFESAVTKESIWTFGSISCKHIRLQQQQALVSLLRSYNWGT